MSEPVRVADVIPTVAKLRDDGLEARQRARETFAATFRCPDPTGAAAPCDGGRYDDRPVVPYPAGGLVVCPIYQKIQCAVFAAIDKRRREFEREKWLTQGREQGIPERYLDASLETAKATPAIDEVRVFVERIQDRARWLAERERGPGMLVFTGGYGLGKTFALSAAVRAVDGARLVSAGGFVQRIMDFDQRAEAMDEAAGVRLLALDDLGVGHLKAGGYAEGAIEELLVERHAQLRPTMLATNWEAAELRKRLGPRVVDRLREWGKVVALRGASLR